jgi:hypothetical protein
MCVSKEVIRKYDILYFVMLVVLHIVQAGASIGTLALR